MFDNTQCVKQLEDMITGDLLGIAILDKCLCSRLSLLIAASARQGVRTVGYGADQHAVKCRCSLKH